MPVECQVLKVKIQGIIVYYKSCIFGMKIAIEECPTLHPTFQQFKCFGQYVERIEKQYSKSYGMVKIVPPAEWISRAKDYQIRLNKLVIQKPQYQSVYGDQRGYYFFCRNSNHSPMSFAAYKEQASQKQEELREYKSAENIQQYFWNICQTLRNQLYCPNVEASLMDASSGQWEFEKLKSFFSEAIKQELLGLNTSFLFIGAWKTFFNWHIEDLDLSAINLLHEGATKMWYAIHPQDRKKYESILKDFFPVQNIKCPNFYRHKQILVNPYKLKEKYPFLRLSKMFQNQGQISLAFANAYHCGFNMGFNIAEAVNYGTVDWLQRYSQFKKCKCPSQIGVEIEYQDIINNLKESPTYEKVKDTQAFAKIVKKAKQEIQADQRFDRAQSNQIKAEIEKQKTKSANKDKTLIYVPKYRRYFPIDEVNYQIQCSSCGKWRKVQERISKMYETKRFQCKMIKLRCKIVKKGNKGDKTEEKKEQKSKKIKKQ